MIHLYKVAEFVHYQVVSEPLRQERNFIAEIQVVLCRTAPPARFCISYSYALGSKNNTEGGIRRLPLLNFPPHQKPRSFFVGEVVFGRRSPLCATPATEKYFIKHWDSIP
jgi:hypothetical protein